MRRCRLATSEGAWVWQMLSVMTICPEQQRCWTAGFKAAPSNSSKWSGGEDLWTKGCAERGARATPPLYNFNLWWMIAEERSGGDKYESVCPGRSSIMPWLLTFDLAGEMDLFFVRKLSLRKLECINQIGNEGGMECKEKRINLNLSCDPYPNRELIVFSCITVSSNRITRYRACLLVSTICLLLRLCDFFCNYNKSYQVVVWPKSFNNNAQNNSLNLLKICFY